MQFDEIKLTASTSRRAVQEENSTGPASRGVARSSRPVKGLVWGSGISVECCVILFHLMYDLRINADTYIDVLVIMVNPWINEGSLAEAVRVLSRSMGSRDG